MVIFLNMCSLSIARWAFSSVKLLDLMMKVMKRMVMKRMLKKLIELKKLITRKTKSLLMTKVISPRPRRTSE